MNVIPTELNQRLSDYVRIRLAAGRFGVAGRVVFWRLLGLGLIAFGIGSSIGVGFYGYSFITKNSENITTLAAVLSKALDQAQLHGTTQGTIQIEPHEIGLAQGQTVSLESNSRVLMDPAAKVSADGEIRVVAPLASPSPPAQIPQRSTRGAQTITNFTVFKTVPFDKGDVMTGWTFLTSSQKTPTEQYCYYTETAEAPGVDVTLDLGRNQQAATPKTQPKNFSTADAFSRCVWFRN